MEHKFKVGDKVTNNEKLFNYLGSDDIIKSIVINKNGEQYCKVNNVFWPTSDLTLVAKQPEFKVGDEVITKEFASIKHGLQFSEDMRYLVGKAGVIQGISDGNFSVHNWYWPASALTLVTKEEFKNGEDVEGSLDGSIWFEGKFVGPTTNGMYIVELPDNFGKYYHCRRPQPKMQKWHVVRMDEFIDSLFVVNSECTLGKGNTIVHTFELPAE